VKQQIRLPRPHVNAYHLDRNLLFQFILSEFLLIHIETSKLNKILRDKNGSWYSYQRPIHQLSGFSQSYMRLLVWNNEEGMLAKLMIYCSLFAQHEHSHEEIAKALHSGANQAWLLGLNCLDILRQIKEEPDYPLFQIHIKKAAQRLIRSIKRLQKLLVVAIEHFPLNENVLFFMLRHGKQLDEIYGLGFIYRFFLKRFSGGVEEADRFIKERYSCRGFSHLLPVISAKIMQLSEGVCLIS
jgi:hypothetical protein